MINKNPPMKTSHRASVIIFLFLLLQVIAFATFIFVKNNNNRYGGSLDNTGFLQGDQVDKILFIQRDSSRNNNKARIHLSSFVKASEKFPKIKIKMVEGVGDNYKVLNSVVDEYYQKGYKNVFVVGFKSDVEEFNTFRKYPDAIFFLYGGSDKSPNVINYSPRTYAMKYLLGLIAGETTKNNKIGYVVDLKNNWNVRSVNAFAIGVARVNPKARVYLAWTYDNRDNGAAKFLTNELLYKENVDLITGSLESCVWCDEADKKGDINFIGQMVDDSDKYGSHYLSSYIYNMDVIYSYFFVAIANGQRVTRDNYWFGNTSGTVHLGNLSNDLSPRLMHILENERQMMRDKISFVFKGPIYSNDDRLIVPEDTTITDRELEKTFDWLNYNVIEYPIDGNYYREHMNVYNEDLMNKNTLEIMNIDDAKRLLNEPKVNSAIKKKKL